MGTKDTIYIEILNKKGVRRAIKALQFTSSIDKSKLKKIVNAPISRMQNRSKSNLTKQRSVITGGLLGSFRTTSEMGRDTYYAKYESSSKYVYSIDKGTKDRYTSSGKWTGAVGHSTTNYKGKNTSFKLGFASRAIQKELPSIKPDLTKGVERVVSDILKRNPTI